MNTYLRYVYSSSNQTVDWFNWEARKNQPDNYTGNEDCVFYYHRHYSDGFWDDEDCEHQNHFVCQKELNSHSTCDLKFPYDTLTFKHNPFQNQTDGPSADTYTERVATRYLRELESIFSVDGPPTPRLRELIKDEVVIDAFHKLSLIQNLTHETLDLVTNVGTLVISELAEHPGPTRKPTEDESFPKLLYYVLKMFNDGPNVSADVTTNLKIFGMCLMCIFFKVFIIHLILYFKNHKNDGHFKVYVLFRILFY